MITVELRRVPEGGHEYEMAASLSVAGDGTYELDDPENLVPIRLHVLVPRDVGLPRRVDFDEDPETWARNLSSLLRTGYLVPVITHDDSTVEPT
jgi:hypothetical protein